MGIKQSIKLFILAFSFISGSQAQTILYQNDFENPSLTNCPNLDGTARTNGLINGYNPASPTPAIFRQANSADRLCIGPGANPYLDPSNTAGNYAIGAHGGRTRARSLEGWGFAIDPAGEIFVNGSIQLSPVSLNTFPVFDFTLPETVPMTVDFYQLPAGEDYLLSVPPSPVSGDPVDLTASISGLLTPIASETTSATNNLGNFTFDWTTYSFTIDTSAFNTGDRLVVVFSGMPYQRYMAFDNIVITGATAAQTVGEPKNIPSISIWGLLSMLVALLFSAILLLRANYKH